MQLTREDAEVRLRMTDRVPVIGNMVGPVGGFALEYELVRAVPGSMEELLERKSIRIDLRAWELVPESDNRGETYESTRNPLSEFSRAVNRVTPGARHDHALGVSRQFLAVSADSCRADPSAVSAWRLARCPWGWRSAAARWVHSRRRNECGRGTHRALGSDAPRRPRARSLGPQGLDGVEHRRAAGRVDAEDHADRDGDQEGDDRATRAGSPPAFPRGSETKGGTATPSSTPIKPAGGRHHGASRSGTAR